MIAWIAAHWGWIAGIGGGTLIIAALAIWFLAPAMIPLILKAVAGWARWAWKHPTGVVCLVLAGVATVGFLDSYGSRQTIVVMRSEAKAASDKCVADLAGKDSVISGYKDQQKVFADASREQARNLSLAQQSSAAALAELARLQASADASNAGWMKVYKARPQSCQASLEAMAVACNSVEKDY